MHITTQKQKGAKQKTRREEEERKRKMNKERYTNRIEIIK